MARGFGGMDIVFALIRDDKRAIESLYTALKNLEEFEKETGSKKTSSQGLFS